MRRLIPCGSRFRGGRRSDPAGFHPGPERNPTDMIDAPLAPSPPSPSSPSSPAPPADRPGPRRVRRPRIRSRRPDRGCPYPGGRRRGGRSTPRCRAGAGTAGDGAPPTRKARKGLGHRQLQGIRARPAAQTRHGGFRPRVAGDTRDRGARRPGTPVFLRPGRFNREAAGPPPCPPRPDPPSGAAGATGRRSRRRPVDLPDEVLGAAERRWAIPGRTRHEWFA